MTGDQSICARRNDHTYTCNVACVMGFALAFMLIARRQRRDFGSNAGYLLFVTCCEERIQFGIEVPLGEDELHQLIVAAQATKCLEQV